MDELPNNFPKMFRLAKNVSKLSNHKRYRLGSVVALNGHPIAVGCNEGRKSHPKAPYFGLHSEMVAVRCCGKHDLAGASIYVYREKKTGEFGNSRPCKHCLELLKSRNFRKIYYTIDEYPFWRCEYL